ncbi:MAG: hypothetical protein Q8Q20_00355 [bacterium]|nr:hypothetical protein [bacterium]
MKLNLVKLKNNAFRIIALLCAVYIAWVGFSMYQSLDEALFHPPMIQDTQISARQEKVNTATVERVTEKAEEKISESSFRLPSEDPFRALQLDSPIE